MSLVAVLGSPATTTAIGLVAAWPAGERSVLLEVDPAGGSAAAWLGVPTEPGLTSLVARGSELTWAAVHAAAQPTASGVDAIVAPIHPGPAAAAVAAAQATLLPIASAAGDATFIADAGRVGATLPPVAVQAGYAVVVHRQHAASAAAAAVGLERLAATCSLLAARSVPFTVLLLGQRPYAAAEVAEFVGPPSVQALPEDPYAAAVFAGRSGQQRRLLRTPLWAALTRIASEIAGHLRAGTDAFDAPDWDPVGRMNRDG